MIDRFIDSTIAYQHFGFGIKKSIIDTIQKFLMKSLKPDFTFLNIVSLKNIKLRLKNRKKLNRYDKFDIRFYEKVQRGFLKILKKKKKRYMIINSDLDVDFNKKMVINKINQLIK